MRALYVPLPYVLDYSHCVFARGGAVDQVTTAEVFIRVDPNLKIREAADIARRAKKALSSGIHDLCSTEVHLGKWMDERDAPACLTGLRRLCCMPVIERQLANQGRSLAVDDAGLCGEQSRWSVQRCTWLIVWVPPRNASNNLCSTVICQLLLLLLLLPSMFLTLALRSKHPRTPVVTKLEVLLPAKEKYNFPNMVHPYSDDQKGKKIQISRRARQEKILQDSRRLPMPACNTGGFRVGSSLTMCRPLFFLGSSPCGGLQTICPWFFVALLTLWFHFS